MRRRRNSQLSYLSLFILVHYRPTFTDIQPTGYQHLTDCRLTVGQQMAYKQLPFQHIVNKAIGRRSIDSRSANRWRTAGRLSVDSSPTVGRLPVEGSCSSQLPEIQTSVILHNYRKIKPRLLFNPRFALNGFRTTGPWLLRGKRFLNQ